MAPENPGGDLTLNLPECDRHSPFEENNRSQDQGDNYPVRLGLDGQLLDGQPVGIPAGECYSSSIVPEFIVAIGAFVVDLAEQARHSIPISGLAFCRLFRQLPAQVDQLLRILFPLLQIGLIHISLIVRHVHSVFAKEGCASREDFYRGGIEFDSLFAPIPDVLFDV